MKLHIGTDIRGRVHSLTATHAAEADIKQLPNLLHGEESAIYGRPSWAGSAPSNSIESHHANPSGRRVQRFPGG
jgi:hypothetical protein